MRTPTFLTRLAAAFAFALFTPAAPALAALPQQSSQADLAAPLPNPLVHGSASNENAGTSVAAPGDLNGDGLGDMLIGAPLADANGRTDSGTAYVVYGRSPLAARTNLGSLSAAGGYRIDGAAAGDRLGSWVAAGGDVNGDGRDDIVIGAPQADPSGRANAGAAYVITDARRTARLDLAQLGSAGYRIDGAAADDRAGTWVAGGGDIDGDGRDDVVVTAPQADPSARSNAGAAYVVRGGGSASVDLAAIGTNGYSIAGGAAGDGVAAAAIVSDSGGDGRDDVLVGAPKSDPGGRLDAGSAWLVPGRDDAASVDLAGAGTRIDGAITGDALGAGVGTSPDVTGDGIDELLIGATGTDQNARANSGSLYLLPARGLPALTDLAVDSPTARIDGAQAGDGIGIAASGGGDMNDDRRADLAVGDSRYDHGYRYDAGAAHVLYGGSLGGAIDLANPPAASTRAIGASSSENAGTALAWLGDANGDGRDDLLAGAYRADYSRSNAGAGYLLLGFGTPSFAYQPSIDATARAAADPARPSAVTRTGEPTYAIGPALPAGMTLDRTSGTISGTPRFMLDQPSVHTLTMTDYAGSDTATVTVRVAPAPGACANERSAFGGGADVFTGSAGGDLIRAGDGNDTVDARGGDDCVHGEAGDDSVTGGAGADQIAGGSENDTLRAGDGNDSAIGEAGNDAVDGDAGDDTVTGGLDMDTLHGGDGNDRVLGEDASDTVFGDGGDDAVTGGPGTDVVDGGDGNDSVAGDEGDDNVRGGAGADDVHGGEGVDEIDAGDGDDRAWAGIEDDTIDGGAGDDQVWAEAGRDAVRGGDGTDLLSGGDGDDVVSGDAGDDELHGAAHHDKVRGGLGDDFAYGETGNDLVGGDAGNDQLFGGPGLDELAGGSGDDRLLGEAQDDEIDGGAGDDVVDGGLGNDRLGGGAGDDVIVGGSGRDTVDESAGRDQIFTDSGDDKVTVRRGGATVESGAGNDLIVAFNGKRDTIVCGSGRDTAYVDRTDRVKGCEKRVHSKPPSAAKRKKSKRKKSSRSRR